MLITTSKLIELLKEQDAKGDKVVFFQVEDEATGDDVAYGALENLTITQKYAYNIDSEYGDVNIVRLHLKLCTDC